MTTSTTDLRITILTTLRGALTAAGFTVQSTFTGRHLDVDSPDPAIGRVGRISLDDVSAHPTTGEARGAVIVDPRSSARGIGRYNARTLNVDGIVRRFLAEAPKVKAEREANARRNARNQADDAILADILASCDLTDDARVSVFDGKVDLKLADLTPAQAVAILALVKGGR